MINDYSICSQHFVGQEKCIVVEAISATSGGGQTYLRNLFSLYEPVAGERVVVIISPRAKNFLSVNNHIEFLTPSFPDKNLFFRLLWNIFGTSRLLKKLGANVLFCPGGTLVSHPNNVRTAVAFQNMLPFAPKERARFPLGYIRLRLYLVGLLQKQSLNSADLVIFISRYAQQVITNVLGKSKESAVVIPHGVGDNFRLPCPRPSDKLPPGEYVLYVSNLDFYKAQLEVVEAWALLQTLRQTHEKLVLVGLSDSPYGAKVRTRISELGMNDKILIMGSIPYHDLPGYYQHAKLNLFASSCENCPNILFEALSAGRAILCSNYHPMPEFGGDAVQYFDPYNPTQLGKLLAEILDDREALAQWGKKASKQAEQFQWESSVQKTWASLRELATLQHGKPSA